ncbi:MAG TPA: tripartite tricarboxylate transporter substrate-binding protein [Alphaproteobacteria bacterium]|nr:tripartite tricarboxylate transporter substrate-binding protein [Alphaproteobacteria bacterium]
MTFLARVCVLVVAFAVCLAGASSAADEAAFYKGRQVRLLIGFGAGGGYDLIARLVARHMGGHFPGGSAQVVPQNVPGAGSLTAANTIVHVAPHDGTVLASIASGIPAAPLLNPEQAKFDSRQLSWIGSAAKETQIDIVWHTSPVRSIDQLKTHELIIGGTGPGAATDDFPAVLKEILGLKFRLIPGYKSTKEVELAMERGEVQALAANTWNSTKARDADWLKEKKILIMTQYGRTRHPDLPDVPLIWDYVHDENDRLALNIVFSRQEMGRPYVAPPALAPERLKSVRSAFDATMRDPAFLADAKKADVDIDALDGEQVSVLVAELYKAPANVVARVRKALSAETRTTH